MEMDRAQWVIGIVGSTLAGIWGQAGIMLQALLLMMLLDIVSGMVAAWGQKALDSNVGWAGVRKKLLMLSLVVAAAIIQPVLAQAVGARVPLAEAAAGFLCAVEGLSVIENAARAGVPVPAFLREALVRLRNTGDAQREATDDESRNLHRG